MKHLLTLVLAAFTIFSCQSGSGRDESTISGKQGDVLVVINKDYWESELGELLRSTLKEEYPMLPQPEARFKVSYVPHSGFTTMFQIQRNIIRVDITSSNLNKVEFRYNIWATPQCVVDIKADSYESALKLVNENAYKIVSFIEGTERERIINNNKAYPSKAAENEVRKIIGGSPVFPKETKVFKQTDDFIWLATCNTDYIKQYIVIYKYPVKKGEDMMSPKSLIEHNLKAINNNVPGTREGSYMTHSGVIEPSVEYYRHNNKSFAELRGLWDVKNDFMGGPFVAHVMYSPDGKYMVGIEGFVYAAKFDKLQYLRDVEAIVYSFEWDEYKK